MKTAAQLLAGALLLLPTLAWGQAPHTATKLPDGDLTKGLHRDSIEEETAFVVHVNTMDDAKAEKLNQMAAHYRTRNRDLFFGMGTAMLSGGTAAIVNVVGTELINLAQIRSKQRKAWLEMRQRECTFVDSLQSVRGQSDFYHRPSSYGPLDPTDMNFDGITFSARRAGHEVLRMVCHIDTSRLDQLFLHSKFRLMVDSIVFLPYRSFLPNLQAVRIGTPRKDAPRDEREQWQTLSQFNFTDYRQPALDIRMELSASWINELVQVFHDVRLGTFSLHVPIAEAELQDSVYVYSRARALAEGRPTLEMEGDCFVVPRSYMPVSANSPSWGTGEYRMKVVLSETCRYNPSEGRSKHWHRDYRQLVRMQNNGKASNDYWNDIVITFRDNRSAILKATYTPLLNGVATQVGAALGGGGTAIGAAASLGSGSAAAAAAAKAQGGAPGAPAGGPGK